MIEEKVSTTTIEKTLPDDNTLIEILKSYYQICRSSADKKILIQDNALMQIITTYLLSSNSKATLYICKILLLLTETTENAIEFSKNYEIVKCIGVACESDLPLRILKNLILVQSRMNNAKRSDEPSKHVKKTFFNKATKQFVFSFDHPTELQKREIEKYCLELPGVVSICFQLNSSLVAKCIVRCREGVEAKSVANQLLRAGLEVVQLRIRLENGTEEIFDFYPDESLGEVGENQKNQKLPLYLDDYATADVFDEKQCVITKEQLEKEKNHTNSTWLSFSSFKFW